MAVYACLLVLTRVLASCYFRGYERHVFFPEYAILIVLTGVLALCYFRSHGRHCASVRIFTNFNKGSGLMLL